MSLLDARDRIVVQRLVTASSDFSSPTALTVYLMSPGYPTVLRDVLITMGNTDGNGASGANHDDTNNLVITGVIQPANKAVWALDIVTDRAILPIASKTPTSIGAPTGTSAVAANSMVGITFTLFGTLPAAVEHLYVAGHFTPA